jgi:hypothetical protein
MVNIKRFIERVGAMESKPGKDLVIPAAESRLLRDEIIKLMADRIEQRQQLTPEITKLEISGGKFK